jgi:hypothetical protein
MKKKFLVGVAPLVVVTAFLVIPAASQGACGTAPNCPHVYKNGVIGKEGTAVRQMAWGNAKLKNGVLGEIECKNIFAGFATNPVGGGAAEGKVAAFFPFECVSAECTKLGGKFIELVAEKMPWVAEVTEPSAGVFRQKTGVKSERGGGAGRSIEFLVNCEGVTKPHFFGENSPLILNNGTAVGLKPGEIEFDLGSGELESDTVGGGTTAGKIKTQGYAGQELIEVKNP